MNNESNPKEENNNLSSKSTFPYIEKTILDYWKQNNTFKNSLKGKSISNKIKEYVFYDGPPFANGLPHYGHLLTGFAKDLFGRYHTMLGEKSERRFGWDCHGLPAEMSAEKELNISGRLAIKEYSIDKFNQYCKSSVLQYTDEWQEYVTKQGRWVDFENDYKTMDSNYMESVIWAFKSLYEKGMLYEDYRVMPYSWACQTPLSNFETHLDNSYKEKKSKSVYVKFLIKNPSKALTKNWPKVKNFFAVVWTTTPWTLPSNLALAINKDIDYTVIEKGEDGYIVAENIVEKISNILQ